MQCFTCLYAWGHTDAPLELKDGNLRSTREHRQIPKEYQPLRYDEKRKLIRIGDHEMELPSFLKSLFTDHQHAKVSFSASWYHDLEELPPYLLVKIEPRDRHFSYHLLLNMKNLTIIDLEVVIDLGRGGTKYLPIDLTAWKEEIAASIKRLNKK